ncbi:MAG: hypothetical protein CL850_03735 [Crocinitomicaceae bacterium]|nr:hypothetical protein [Crocinitomicaceae bacterium]
MKNIKHQKNVLFGKNVGKLEKLDTKLNKKKILFVSPYSGKFAALSQFHAPPLGVMRVASYLNKKGHEAEYFDPNLHACNQKGPDLEQILKDTEWDIVGFSLLDETLLEDIKNIYLAKKIRPNALLVAGGVEAQFNYQQILDKTPCKIVILGEGEIPMLMIANDHNYNDIPGIVVKNPAKALSQELFNEATDSIPWETINYEDYWAVYKEMYGDEWNKEIEDSVNTIRVFSRNRCPIGCKYCSSTFQLTLATEGKVPVISQTEESLIHVIKRIKNAHKNVKMIYLTDDDFIINKRSVIRFCKLVVENKLNDLKFMAFSRITDLNEEVISWLKKANFVKLNIGVESFSERVLKEVGKRCPVEEIDPVLKLLKKYNIRPFMNIILTTPETKIEDVELTVDRTLEYIKDPFYMAGIIIGIQPLKGTIFYEEYTNFKSYITDIEGSSFKIRRDDYIWATDPKVKKLQKIYLETQADFIKNYIQENNIKHPNQAVLAPAHLILVKQIIEEIKNDTINLVTSSDQKSAEGEGRNFANSPLYNAYIDGQNITKKRSQNTARKFKGIKITTA